VVQENTDAVEAGNRSGTCVRVSVEESEGITRDRAINNLRGTSLWIPHSDAHYTEIPSG
jgi:hypothetical protein